LDNDRIAYLSELAECTEDPCDRTDHEAYLAREVWGSYRTAVEDQKNLETWLQVLDESATLLPRAA
jgi:hypothetical protein